MQNRSTAVARSFSFALALASALGCATSRTGTPPTTPAPPVASTPAPLLVAPAAPAAAASLTSAAVEAPQGPLRKLVIVGINDTHGALLAAQPPRWVGKGNSVDVGGADWFAGYLTAIRAQARAEGAEVLLLDGGDLFQGTLISNQFLGRSVTDVYNQIGVTAAAIGNHEFDFGLQALKERVAQARFPMLAANIFLKGQDRRPDWARPTAIVEAGGTKVGIIGLTTVETPLTTNPANIADFEFRPGGPIAAQLADELRAQGCTVVLITAHMGPRSDGNIPGEIVKVAEAVKGKVDAINSGHHHDVVGPPPLVAAGIPIVQSGSKLVAFSLIELALDAQGHVRGFSVNEGTSPRPGGPQAIFHDQPGRPALWRGTPVVPDAEVAALIHGYDVQVKELRESPVGATRVTLLKGGRDDLLANLTADALRSGAGGGLPADFAFQNSGGLRIQEIAAGPITFGQLFDLYPFDNQQIVVQLSGTALRDALEAVLRVGKGPLRVSGLRYTVDWARFNAGKDFQRAPAGAIVTEVVDERSGKRVCATRSCTATGCDCDCAAGPYSLSVTDFLANGGDGLELLKQAPRKVGTVLASDIIVAYVKQHSPLTAEQLGSLAVGRPERVTVIGSVQGAQAE